MLTDLDRTEHSMLREGRSRSGAEVLAWWRAERNVVLVGLGAREPSDRIPWITGQMSAVSFATARLMETWAHGQDVVEGLRVALPDADVRVEVMSPDGELWSWGASTTHVVRGDALDFCLVVTKRRRPDDTSLEVIGPLAREWIDIAQAFAGPPLK